jgi:chromosome segregation ATPase
LGVLILSDPDYEVPAAAYQHQAESLISKIDSLEERLAELEDKDGNVFVLMGKSVQGLITRSSLKKNKNSLEQIYRSAGEQFSRDDAEVFETDGETAGLIGKIVKAKELSKNIEEELVSLREERGKISGVFSAHGGPVKYIQELGKNISKARAAQKLIARRFGEAAYDFSAAGTKSAAKKKPFTDIVTGDDKQILEKIKLVRSTISDYDEQIKKLTAAIAIDEERAVIEKMQKSIADQKKRITAAEETITEAEGRIVSSEKHISELEKDL